jgi:hypothetical protein
MPEPPSTFRDFGIIPDDLPPPPERLECYFSGARVFGQYLATSIAAGLGLGLALLFAFTLPLALALLACPAALAGFGTFIYLVTRNDYGWIELQGNTLRARHLYTRRTIEHSVADIDNLTTMVNAVMVNAVSRLETHILEKLLGRVRGIEIRFRGEPMPLRVIRSGPAMTGAKELIEAIVYRMQHMGELDYEIVDFAGKPLLRKIYWKGKPESSRPASSANVGLGSLIGLSLMFGTALAFAWSQEQELRTLASIPPHEIALSALIRGGPGDNRHLTITNFRPGGYTWESRNGVWSDVWIALFPAEPPLGAGQDIAAVLHSSTLLDEASLRRVLENGRIIGICSAGRSSSWGAELGKNLVLANPGCQLSSAWSIEELRAPPGEAQVTGLLAGAVACFVAVLALAFIIYLLAEYPERNEVGPDGNEAGTGSVDDLRERLGRDDFEAISPHSWAAGPRCVAADSTRACTKLLIHSSTTASINVHAVADEDAREPTMD